MYFLVALGCAAASGLLWFFFRNRKGLHLEVLTLTYSAATLMWLIDCIFSAAKGGGFLSFDYPTDGWISLATLVSGIFLWLVIAFILNNSKKVIKQS